jgi:hypothetical protein
MPSVSVMQVIRSPHAHGSERTLAADPSGGIHGWP